MMRSLLIRDSRFVIRDWRLVIRFWRRFPFYKGPSYLPQPDVAPTIGVRFRLPPVHNSARELLQCDQSGRISLSTPPVSA